ncbi:MAG: HAD-IA family hydrolase [Gemmatimonadaceae bacterium]
MHATALLFDLDGVLVDSVQCVRSVCTDWALAHGLDPEFLLRSGQGRRVQDTVRAVAPHLDLETEVARLVAMEAQTTEGLYPIEGARELLAALPPHAWAVVTSGAREVATLRLRYVGLPIPGTLVTADDVSQGKPHPEGYLAAARALGRTPSDCVVIEDAPPGIEAAIAAGMRSIGIAGTFAAADLCRATVVLPSLAAMRINASPDGGHLEIRWQL